MAGQWKTWLAALKAAGKGGLKFTQLQIDRGLPYSKTLAFGLDLSADTITAALRVSPDAPDPVLVDFTVDVGAYASGVTEVTLSLTAVQTSDTDILPADGDLDGEEELVFDLLRNDARLIAGTIPIAGKVTNAS